MGYLFLACALLAGVTKGYCGKRTSGLITGFSDAVLTNLLRIGLCIFIGFAVVCFEGNLQQLAPSGKLLWISALSGVSTAAFVATWLICVRKSAYMLMDVFLTLGMLIPLLLSNLLFDEKIRLQQWLGMGILLIAVLILCSYNNSIKEKLKPASLLLLIFCGAVSGTADFSQKLFVRQMPETAASVFNFYTYIFAAIALTVWYLCIRQKTAPEKTVYRKVAGYVAVMAACLFANSFFKTLAAEHLDAILLYPLNQGAALILSTLMSSVCFRERITVKCICGIVIAFVGLLVINL